MNKIALALVLSLCFAAPAAHAAPDLTGEWLCGRYNLFLSLQGNGQYALRDPNGQTVRSVWSAENGVLSLQDPGSGRSITYSIKQADGTALRLVDAYGIVLDFERRSPLPPAGTPSTSGGAPGPAEEQVRTYLRFVGFLVNRPLSEEDAKSIREQAASAFTKNPDEFAKEVRMIDGSMQKAYALTDPVQIGLVRQALMAGLFRERMGNQELDRSPIMRIIDQYCPVLAHDPATGLVLTRNDLAGILDYVEFVQGLGQPGFALDPGTRDTLAREIVGGFPSFSPEQKKAYVTAGLASEWLKKSWRAMNEEQKKRFAAGFTQGGQSAPAPGAAPGDPFSQGVAQGRRMGQEIGRQAGSLQGGCPRCLTIMADMNTQSHATALNIIENIGGTGNYWEVKPDWQTW
ncbi:MAG: hypothetical protein AB1921_02155 [Thermodesulfobacteriota bacterium]